MNKDTDSTDFQALEVVETAAASVADAVAPAIGRLSVRSWVEGRWGDFGGEIRR